MRNLRLLVASLVVLSGALLSGCLTSGTEDARADDADDRTAFPPQDPSPGPEPEPADTGSGGTAPDAPPPNAPPVAVLQISAMAASVGANLTFTASGSSDPDGDALTYAWDFGDGASGSEAEMEHAYEAPGNFTVNLTVSDGEGATDSEEVTVTIEEPPVQPGLHEEYAGTLTVAIPLCELACGVPELEGFTYDRYLLNLTGGVSGLHIELNWTADVGEPTTIPDLDMYLLDGEGNDVSDAGGATGSAPEIIASDTLAAGEYVVLVHLFAGGETEYVLTVTGQIP